MTRILVTGACGQLGTELIETLREKFDPKNVISTDIHLPDEKKVDECFELLDVLDQQKLTLLINKYEITQIYHLAAILSAKAEQQPLFAWELNVQGLLNVLETARHKNGMKVYWPSSIGVFGHLTPKINAPQDAIMNPDTVYGISKLAGERWCEYYYNKYQVDVRSLRYPGIIGYKSQPGGGTTDYAVDIFYKAIKEGHFDCFLTKDTRLPMMYMNDAIRATVEIMQAPVEKLTIRSSYNVASMSFSPEELATAIRSYYPDFTMSYTPDYRQEIASAWPGSIDDSHARKDWGWRSKFNLNSMVKDMLQNITKNLVQH